MTLRRTLLRGPTRSSLWDRDVLQARTSGRYWIGGLYKLIDKVMFAHVAAKLAAYGPDAASQTRRAVWTASARVQHSESPYVGGKVREQLELDLDLAPRGDASRDEQETVTALSSSDRALRPPKLTELSTYYDDRDDPRTPLASPWTSTTLPRPPPFPSRRLRLPTMSLCRAL